MRALAVVACLLAVAAGTKVQFGLFNADSSPGGGWVLASLNQIEVHKLDFVQQYNADGGLSVIKEFKSENCCISLASGKMITIVGSPYQYQFPAASSDGGIVCNPTEGYGVTAYSFYRTTKVTMNTEFSEMHACVQKQNPGIWIRSTGSTEVKALPTPEPTAEEKQRTKYKAAGHLCIDCKTTAWTNWGECSKLCDGGVHKRYRVVSNVPNLCGEPCPENLEDAKSCNNAKCIKANMNDVTPGMFFSLKFTGVTQKMAMEQSKRYTDVLTSVANWYPGWVKVEEVHEAGSDICPVLKVGTHEYSLVKDKNGEPVNTNGNPTYRRGKAESWVEVKSDFLYYFESSKGSKMWLIGPNLGSAKAHTLGQVTTRTTSLNQAEWFTFAEKWNKASMKAVCLPHYNSQVRFFLGAPKCGEEMKEHVKVVEHTLKSKISTVEKRLGLTIGTIQWKGARMHNMACEPAIKLSVVQLTRAKPIKTQCKFEGSKLRMEYKVPAGHAHNCYHKKNPRTQQWDCMCHSWSVAP
jgi:hypothetical protein